MRNQKWHYSLSGKARKLSVRVWYRRMSVLALLSILKEILAFFFFFFLLVRCTRLKRCSSKRSPPTFAADSHRVLRHGVGLFIHLRCTTVLSACVRAGRWLRGQWISVKRVCVVCCWVHYSSRFLNCLSDSPVRQ